MLKVEGLTSAYGRVEVLHGVELHVRQGEIVTVVGSNGAGKTTLLRAISGVQPISAGRIEYAGRAIERVAAHSRLALGMAQVPEGRHVFQPLSVEDNLLLGGWTLSAVDRKACLKSIYAEFPVLEEKRALSAGGLSGGQQQMLAIGRALMSRPKLLLLDEPSMGLSPILVDQVFTMLPRFQAQGITVLIVEQNAYAALAAADRGYVLDTGRVALEGAASELLHDPQVCSTYLGLDATA